MAVNPPFQNNVQCFLKPAQERAPLHGRWATPHGGGGGAPRPWLPSAHAVLDPAPRVHLLLPCATCRVRAQAGESVEAVWQSALGCWLQLSTHGGYVVEAWLRHMPPAALAHLARACIAYSW